MNRETVIGRLRDRRESLLNAGVSHMALFGSCARGHMRDGSDIDLLVTFADPQNLSLLDVVRLENDLSDYLGHAVQISRDPIKRDSVRRRVDAERINVF